MANTNNKNIGKATLDALNTWGKVAVAVTTEVASVVAVGTDYAIDNVDYIGDISSKGYKHASNYGRAKTKNMERINKIKDAFNNEVEESGPVA